jgi:CRISPR-associated protein Csd1
MLELLSEYARHHAVEVETRPGLKPKTIRWAIICNAQGQLQEVVELGDAGQKKNRGQEFPRCPDLSAAEMNAGGETKSHFLVDTAEVVTLLGDKADEEKVQTKHGYFIRLLDDANKSLPGLSGLASLLKNADELKRLRKMLRELKAKPNEKVTFRLGDSYPVESKLWHGWWEEFRASFASDAGRRMVCLVSGKAAPALKVQPAIDGLRDVGGSMGPVLVGFDKDAFGSYGLEQSENAAVSEEAAYEYRAALNYLIANHSRRLSGTKVVHWFKQSVKSEDDPLSWLEEPPEVEERNAQHLARELLEGIKAGRRADLGGNHYYALALSGAGGRVMVRDWIEGQFEDLVANVSRWFDDISIVHREGGRLASDPRFKTVMDATVREPSYDPPDPPAPFVVKM